MRPPGVVYGVVIILVMILAPGGVIGLLRRAYAWVLRKRGGSATEAAAGGDRRVPHRDDEPVHTGTGI